MTLDSPLAEMMYQALGNINNLAYSFCIYFIVFYVLVPSLVLNCSLRIETISIKS